ncbi:hypothetical protein BOTBODRAFT_117491 [Botryobasidium botryosum FD-172 SS1]|uniref:DUF6589 domain-containing protein n=1 Tax=Botryobasidium botryosum (strain FD-172 SS1) TaxID=930990 RepID=A0A067M3C5_BOTB1|nr:hypothetical protein BOTBODRAFT_117491 [Botryobasidium botryosum FD-172 SS1]
MIAKQIYWVHTGSVAGFGLGRDISLLKRIGLAPKTKQTNPDYHDLKEIITHILKAHVLCCWLQITGSSSLAELAKSNPSPADLVQWLQLVVDKIILGCDVHNMQRLPTEAQDQVFVNACTFIRDALVFHELVQSIWVGDVGQMMDLLPQLTMMCIGSGNSNYVVEFLDLMQRMTYEWKPEFCDLIWDSCWLANTSGKRNGFFPLDQLQEHNSLWNKVIFVAEGPNASWKYLGMMSPIIPMLRRVSEHVVETFGVASKGKHYQGVSCEKEIELLMAQYIQEKVHTMEMGGHVSPDGLGEDVLWLASEKLMSGDVLKKWKEGKEVYIRETGQSFKGSEWAETDELVQGMGEEHEQDVLENLLSQLSQMMVDIQLM